MKRYLKIVSIVLVQLLLVTMIGCNKPGIGKDVEKMSTNQNDGISTSNSDLFVSVKEYGALGNGVNDDADAIQKALYSVSKKGGTVFIPSGVYRMGKGVKVPVGVNIEGTTHATTGPWQQFLDAQDKNLVAQGNSAMNSGGDTWMQFEMYKGTWILVDHGAGDINSAPTFQMEGSSSIKKIGFVHKGLPPITNSIVEYPPAIGVYSNMSLPYTRDGVTVEDISIANSYIGIAFAIGKDLKDYYLDKKENDLTASFGRHRIHNVMGGPLYRGIMLKGLLDTIDINNIQFNYSNYEQEYLAARTRNCIDIEVARMDGLNLSNVLSFGANCGLKTVPAFGRSVSLRAVNLNLEAQIPMSLKASGQYEISNSYFLTLNFANLCAEKKFTCIEIETDSKCIHQSFFVLNNLVFQNSIMAADKEDMILDIKLDGGSNVVLGNSMFWGWDSSAQGDPVIRFTHKNSGPASLNINNCTFTSTGLKGKLVEVTGSNYRRGNVEFSDCRIPASLQAQKIAEEGNVWFKGCTTFETNGFNNVLDNRSK